jgi:hypothetical protein
MWIDWPRQHREKRPDRVRKGKSVTLEFQNGNGESGSSGGGGTTGIPDRSPDRETKDNAGKSINDWRSGRGTV